MINLEPIKEIIRLDLEGKEAKRLNYIKTQRGGLKFNTEIVRLLIFEEFKRLGGKDELL